MTEPFSPAALTIQNLEPGVWLVTLAHDLNEHESITIRVRVPGHNRQIHEVQNDLVDRATTLLSTMRRT